MMGAAKEAWFKEVERLMAEYIDLGMDPEDAYDRACDIAHMSWADRMADLADIQRKRDKGE